MKRFSSGLITKILLSCTVIAGSISGSAVFAAGNTQATVSANNVISVHDIVPESYFETYKGKFGSVEELKEAAGYDGTNAAGSTEKSDDVASNKSIKVDSLDEYAALLYYYNDLAANAESSPAHVEKRMVAKAATDGYWTTYEKTWNDQGVSWMKSYVTVRIVNDKIEADSATTDSALLGFHPGNSWTHKAGASYVNINSTRTGGSAHIVGVLTLSIIWEGVGDITSKTLTHDWTF